MAFDPAHYGSRIILAAADFRSFTSSGKNRNSPFQQKASESASPINAASLPPDDVEPLSLREIAARFIDAGATALIAPTDRVHFPTASSEVSDDRGTTNPTHDDTPAIMMHMREAANTAKERKAVVFGAIGPVDQLLGLGEIDEPTLSGVFTSHARVLKECGADAILCRSFTELESLIIAIRAAKVSTGLPVIASMTFDSGPDFTQTVLGITIPQMCNAVAETGVFMVGCDGSEFPDGAPAIVTMLREACKLPVYIEVSAGRSELRDDGIYYPESPKDFAERLDPLLMAGARIIGGGRGVSIDHIAEMSRIMERLEKRHLRGLS